MIKIAKIISVLTHPVFAPLYLLLLLFLQIGLFENQSESVFYAIAFFSTTLILLPMLTVFLFYRFNFISSIFNPTKRDRIFMLLIIIFFYAFNLYLWFGRNPYFLFTFLFATLLATTVFVFIVNFFFNISLHATAWGGIFGFYLIICRISVSFSFPLIAAIVLIGAIAASSRLILRAHKPNELYLGYLCGLITVFAMGSCFFI